MTETNISVITNSFIPGNASIELTVYQNVGRDTESTKTDPEGRSYDQKDTILLDGGAAEINRADIPYRQGSEVWFIANFDSDGVNAPTLDEVTLRPSRIADSGSVTLPLPAVPLPNLTETDAEIVQAEVVTLQQVKKIIWETTEDFNENQFETGVIHPSDGVRPEEYFLPAIESRIVLGKKSPRTANSEIPENPI